MLISENASRDALMRLLDFQMAIGDLANQYSDLPIDCITSSLVMKAHEIIAAANLPKQYTTPPKGETE